MSKILQKKTPKKFVEKNRRKKNQQKKIVKQIRQKKRNSQEIPGTPGTNPKEPIPCKAKVTRENRPIFICPILDLRSSARPASGRQA